MKTLYAFLGGAALTGVLAFLIWNHQQTRIVPVPVAAVQPEPAAYVPPAPAVEPPPPPPAVEEKPKALPKPVVTHRAKTSPAPVQPAEPIVNQAPPPPVTASTTAPQPADPPATPAPVRPEPQHPQILKPDPVEVKRARDERAAQTVTIPAGTVLHVRMNQVLSSERNENGDTFSATLDEPLVANGFVIAEKGSRLDGQVVDAQRAGKVKGLAQLSVRLVQLHTADNQRIAILTDDFAKTGKSSKTADAAKVGIGAGVGAALGAIFGGGKGAAIGAASGGAAGGGAVLMTRGKPAEIDVETKIPFRLREPVTITENLR